MDFIKGMDISFLQECMEKGMRIRDLDGGEIQPFALMKKYGVNSVRLRLWNQPEKVAESGGYCSLSRTIEMAKQIKENGLHFLLDFHYSDFWADPANQKKPVAWENLHGEELERAVYDYTKDVLLAFKKEEAFPDMVQIGNEIRSGLLFPDGELPDTEGMVRLVNAGICAAREVGKEAGIKIMIHLDQGGRFRYLEEWFDHAYASGLEDFDVIGLSFYPFWHGSFYDLKESCEKLINKYQKPIVIAETAHAWKLCEGGFVDQAQVELSGMEASEAGQQKELEFVMDIMASLPDKKGLGIYYWEPLCVPFRKGEGGWASNMSLLREDGTVLSGIRAFGYRRRGFTEEEKKMLTTQKEGQKQSETEETVDFEDGKNLIGSVVRFEGKSNFLFEIHQAVKILKEGTYRAEMEYQGTDTTNVDIRLYVSSQDADRKELIVHPVEHFYSTYHLDGLVLKKGTVIVGVSVKSSPAWGKIRSIRLKRMDCPQ